MNFGDAVKQAKNNGEKITREGWNGKGMYVYYVPENSYPAITEVANLCSSELCATNYSKS